MIFINSKVIELGAVCQGSNETETIITIANNLIESNILHLKKQELSKTWRHNSYKKVVGHADMLNLGEIMQRTRNSSSEFIEAENEDQKIWKFIAHIVGNFTSEIVYSYSQMN